MIKRWIPSIRRLAISVASFIVAIVVKDVSEKKQTSVYIAAGIAVALIVLLDEYWTAVRPAKRIEELAPITLDGLVDRLIEELRVTTGVTARVNLMMIERTWRWLGLRKYFRMRWHKGMDNQPDVNLCFPVRFGVSGECVRDKQPVYAGNEEVGKFTLPERKNKLTKQLTAILSFPVYEQARTGIQSGRIVGVLNLDSASPGAYNLLVRQDVLDQINKVMQTTAAIAGRFFG